MWTINVLYNRVAISAACAKALFKAQKYDGEIWDAIGQVVSDGRLRFNENHMEHMDYLGSHDWAVKTLCAHRVSGDICFGSLEGDNAGSFWGYRFDGKGRMTPLTGDVVFKEVEQTIKGATVVVTGRLTACTREKAHALIRKAGGTPKGRVDAKTDVVVVGTGPGSNAKKARKFGITPLDEDTFLALVGHAG